MRYALALVTWVAGLWLSPDIVSASARPQTRILVLHPYDRTLPASIRAEDSLRSGLAKHYGENIEIYSEYLELNRFSNLEHRKIMADYLTQKFASKRISLAVAIELDPVSGPVRARIFPSSRSWRAHGR